MNQNWIPLEDRVFIKQDAAAEEIKGLHIPVAAQTKPPAGIIMKIGPGKPKGTQAPIGYSVNDKFVQNIDGLPFSADDRIVPVFELPLKEGDHVLFAAHAGVPVDVNGEPMLCMRMSDVICRV
jgi:co-chaperonin GroES (HSP10)